MVETGAGLADAYNARGRYILVRTGVTAASALPEIRRVLHDLDPNLPFSRPATIDEMVDASLQQPRGLSVLVAALALVALALSIVGIYGVMAHYVQQQAKDISIRLALGGSPGGVVALMVRRGMTLVAWGVAAGVVAAVALARLLATMLFGVSPGDPLTFSAVVALMLGGALVACGIPAVRAAAVEPAEVLRND